MQEWQLTVGELPDPVPGPGQVLAKVLACGICGSDLHLLRHGAQQLALGEELRRDQPLRPRRHIEHPQAVDRVVAGP